MKKLYFPKSTFSVGLPFIRVLPALHSIEMPNFDSMSISRQTDASDIQYDGVRSGEDLPEECFIEEAEWQSQSGLRTRMAIQLS